MLVSTRFDLSVIILSNFLFILLYIFPFPLRQKFWYRGILKFLYLFVNSIALLANCVDLVYFQFTLKRTNASVFNFFSGEIGNDLGNLLPVFLKDYWYVLVIWLGLIYGLFVWYRKIERNIALDWSLKQYGTQTLLFVAAAAFGTLIYRGGFQLKPISIVSAGEYVSSKFIPLVINTPFSIIKTYDVKAIEPSESWHIEEAELRGLYNTKHWGSRQKFRKLNVFVIALESFSKEYVGALNGRSEGYTPFLDSLISKSLTFSNAFSNGKTSIEGIPSIIAGIPTWMNEPYITSPYGSNQIQSIASLLKQKGYYTAFFHGGTNGTMGFDAFANLAGYTDYFGRTEYNNDKDYDGNWGIWDEEFLQFTANTLNKKKQPFHATLFTLTSHHPYPIPERYKERFKGGSLPIEKGIRYTDYCLKRFFETAKKMPWFKNTLFVLAADHTGVSNDLFYTNNIGNYMIPIIYYMPGNNDLRGMDTTLTQQIDILPSVLSYLHYPSSYFAFGNSVFDHTTPRFALTYNYGIFQLVQNNYFLQFDGDGTTNLHHFPTDSLLSNNLIYKDTIVAKQMDKKIKAIIQTYQQSLINNQMVY
jgi:phosphoglycerol transferase MdoB-like AlkP superfamily enzyme